jgi:ectoine hydroxylase-related dioxygenase (phytanoyl-CoA dioxygenase family)
MVPMITVVPGSHQYGARPQPNRTYPGETIVTTPAGSVLVYNAFLWHGSSPNTSGQHRRGLFGYFTRPFCKQQFDTTRGCPPGIFARLSDRQKHLLGFDSVSGYED